jgi:hypothetical protein
VLLDLLLADRSDPADNVRRIAGAGPRVLVVSVVAEPDQIMAAYAAGAAGYLTKDRDLDERTREAGTSRPARTRARRARLQPLTDILTVSTLSTMDSPRARRAPARSGRRCTPAASVAAGPPGARRHTRRPGCLGRRGRPSGHAPTRREPAGLRRRAGVGDEVGVTGEERLSVRQAADDQGGG